MQLNMSYGIITDTISSWKSLIAVLQRIYNPKQYAQYADIGLISIKAVDVQKDGRRAPMTKYYVKGHAFVQYKGEVIDTVNEALALTLYQQAIESGFGMIEATEYDYDIGEEDDNVEQDVQFTMVRPLQREQCEVKTVYDKAREKEQGIVLHQQGLQVSTRVANTT